MIDVFGEQLAAWRAPTLTPWARVRHAVGLVGRFGNRIANDLLVDDAPTHDPAFLEELIALELTLCDREPFHRVGFAWQVVLER